MAGHSRSKNGVASLAHGPGHQRLWSGNIFKMFPAKMFPAGAVQSLAITPLLRFYAMRVI